VLSAAYNRILREWAKDMRKIKRKAKEKTKEN